MKKGFFALGTLVALLAMALPAQAAVIEREHYTFSESSEFEECGFSIRSDFTASGHFRTRVGKHDLDTAFFGLDNYEYSDRWTNTANGRSLTIWGNAVIRDVKATHVEGSIFQFTTVESGRPFNLVDASGRVVMRDRGAIRETYTFDTDPVNSPGPGGIFLETLSLRVSGPHPGFDLSDDEFCAVITPLLS
jgi:hypothetical protein